MLKIMRELNRTLSLNHSTTAMQSQTKYNYFRPSNSSSSATPERSFRYQPLVRLPAFIFNQDNVA